MTLKRSPMPPRTTPLKSRTSLNRTGKPKDTGRGRENRLRAHPKRRSISPASPAQRAFVQEFGYCIGCGREASDWLAIDPAHLWPRGRGGCDSRFCVVPLCRAGDGSGCHRELGESAGDLLSILMADYGRWVHHIQHALRHASPVEVLERLAGQRIQWSGS